MSVPLSAGEFDYIIVGGGTGGCVIANRLTADSRTSVLLLEAGGKDSLFWMRPPLGAGQMMTREDVMWQFVTEPVPQLGDRKLNWPRGKVIGGSSSVNGTIFSRGDPVQYDLWRSLGNPGWGYDDVLPYFKRLEDYPGGDPKYRGRGGPVRISDTTARDPVTLAFVAACIQVGIKQNPDYNGADMEGIALHQYNTRRGRRQSAAVAYLHPVIDRPNLIVKRDALVSRILLENRRATGVTFMQNGQHFTARAKGEVLLAAGSISSPHLLELSGIGNSEILKSKGIKPIHHLKGVGENLIDHLQARLTFEAQNATTFNTILRSPWRKALIGLEYLMFGRGWMSTPLCTAHALTRSTPDVERPDVKIQIHHFSGKDRTSYKANLGIDPYPGLTIGIYPLTPKSRGSSHLRDADAHSAPQIRPNLLSHPDDIRSSIEGLKLARKISQQPALSPYLLRETRPGVEVESDEALLEYYKMIGQTAFHPVGTCKMGHDEDAVVDAELKVHGLQGLRVVDGSVMPTMPASNTNAAVLMIAEKAADMIKTS